MAQAARVSVFSVGDVFPDIPDGRASFAPLEPLFARADCHHHSLRGIELHRGKPIFYGLGTLIHHCTSIKTSPAGRATREARFGERSSFAAAEEFPLFPFRADARRTGIAVTDLHADGTIETGLIPAMILADGATEPLRADDQRAAEVADYVERLRAQSGFATRFERATLGEWLLLKAV